MVTFFIAILILIIGYLTYGKLTEHVFGSILGGAVHDYMTGMVSERHNGASIARLAVSLHCGYVQYSISCQEL